MYYLYGFLLLIAIIVLIAVPYSLVLEKRRKREIERIFGGRQKLDERDFYETYFRHKNVPFFVVQRIRQILEDELDADLSRLSPEDDFSGNLSFFWDYEVDAEFYILNEIEKEFEIKIGDAEAASRTRTVEDLIDLVWEKVREKDA